MQQVFVAFGRALVSQLHGRMLLLTFLPFIFSILIWSVGLWWCLSALSEWVQAYFFTHEESRIAVGLLTWFGVGMLKTIIIPLLTMWLLLPLMILTALLFVASCAMPAIAKHVAHRHYPALAERRGGTLLGSLWMSLSSFVIFILLWIVTLPLSVIPFAGLLILPVLWGWLSYRVFTYDALSSHADRQELKAIFNLHRWPLLAIGIATGTMGAAPALLWLGGALSVIFFPLAATVSIWLYVLVFVFTGLWFQHYCLEALVRYRSN